jgi:Ca-activated chloride channel family protein
MRQPVYNILLLILFLASPPVWASRAAGEIKKGNALYAKGQFAPAVEHYQKAVDKDPRLPAVEYDLGTALYKKGNYVQATEHLNKALLSDDPALVSRAHFNLGNALYRSGKGQEKANIDQAIAALEKSLAQYQKVITADPKDTDAQFNYNFVKQELERMKQKKQEQKNQQDQKQQNQKNQQQNQQKPEDQQNQQDKNQDQQNKDQQNQQNNPNSQDQQKPSSQDQNKENPGQDQNKKPEGQDKKQDQDKQDQQKNKGGGGDQNPEPSENNNPPPETQSQTPGGMTPQEANMVLGDYERNEEPKGMLYFVPEKAKDKPVTKDW